MNTLLCFACFYSQTDLYHQLKHSEPDYTMFKIISVHALCLAAIVQNASAFTSFFPRSPVAFASKSSTSLNAEKVAIEVTGAELEVMLTEWDQPLILDAYGRST